MKLKDYDWDKQGYVEHDYPDGPIAEFVNFFRTTKAWVDDPERINRRVLALERALAAHRDEQRLAAAATAVLVTTPSPKPAPAPKRGGRRAAHAQGE